MNFNDGTKDQGRADPSIVINSPTKFEQCRYRSSRLSGQRSHIRRLKSERDLLRYLHDVIADGKADTSVIAVAVQSCGASRWWRALLRIRRMQRDAEVPMNVVLQSCYLKALAECSRGDRFGAVPGRGSQVLELGRQVWSEADPNAVGLSSALALCAAVDDPGGLQWAEDLWSWAEHRGHRSDMLANSLYARVLASHKRDGRVDDMLLALRSRKHIWEQRGFDHRCLLSALVDIAGQLRAWQRADELWRMFVDDFGIEPNAICYSALAKAHLLCGRPGAAAAKFDEALARGLPLHSKTAIDHVQALLVICHSSLAPRHLDRLQSALQRGEDVLAGASEWEQSTWRRLADASRQLASGPASLRFQDVLVEWKAGAQSAMKDWGDPAAGSNYLVESVQ